MFRIFLVSVGQARRTPNVHPRGSRAAGEDAATDLRAFECDKVELGVFDAGVDEAVGGVDD